MKRPSQILIFFFLLPLSSVLLLSGCARPDKLIEREVYSSGWGTADVSRDFEEYVFAYFSLLKAAKLDDWECVFNAEKFPEFNAELVKHKSKAILTMDVDLEENKLVLHFEASGISKPEFEDLAKQGSVFLGNPNLP